jgi:hypothetical protein
MTLSEAWDRLFWSALITVGIGLIWMRFLESVIGPCEGPGLLAALAVGITFFVTGWRSAAARKQRELDEAKDEL